MNDLEHDIRKVLERDAERAPLVTRAPSGLRSRVRRRQVAAAAIGVAAALVVVTIVAGALVLLPLDHGRPAGVIDLLERSNVLGVSIEHPSDWPLLHLADGPLPSGGGREVAPVLQLTNFDPEPVDDSRSWICPFPSGTVPEKGVVLYVQEVLADPSDGSAEAWPVNPTAEVQPWWDTACVGDQAARFRVHGRTYEAFLIGDHSKTAYPRLLEAFRSMTFSRESPVYAGLGDRQQGLSLVNAAAWVLASGEQAGVPWSLLGIRVHGGVCLGAEIDGRTSDLACGTELGAPAGGLGKPVLFEARGASLAFGMAAFDVDLVQARNQALFETLPAVVVPYPAGWNLDIARAYVAPGPPVATVVAAFRAGDEIPVDGVSLISKRNVLATVADGTWTPLDQPTRIWEIVIVQGRGTPGMVCIDNSATGSYCTSGTNVDNITRYLGPLEPFGTTTFQNDAGTSTYGWGAFRDPVADIRIELDDGTTVEPLRYEPPSDFPELGQVYVFMFDGAIRGRVLGLGSDGTVVESQRIDL